MDFIDRMQDLEGVLLQSQIDQVVGEALGAPGEGGVRRCTDCGEPVPAKRLRALPGATRCLPCQEGFERADGPRGGIA